jgi:NADH-quinone oxidoreductase subunit B
MEGLLLLRDAVGREDRPLSWIVGPQGVIRPERPAMKELKKERLRATELRPPDHV